ncbi:UDP-glucuronosyl/UDP-glucosyltransferase [Dillenia turbinata]|uniref:Glycosyltransferase n=1 Tax=Dillenia turbinata TaxID=194707 RepID=A0AAN8WA85_9MAGN
MTNSSHQSVHVAVLPFPFASHVGSLLSLVQRLAEYAPDSVFSCFSTSKSIQKNFPTPNKTSNVRPYIVDDGLTEGYVIGPDLEEQVGYFLEAAADNFRRGMEVAMAETGRRVSCVMSDTFCWFSANIAEEMHVPWVAMWNSGPFALSAHLHTDLLRQTFDISDLAKYENQSLEFIPGLSAIRVKDIPPEILHENPNSTFPRMLDNMVQVLPRARAIAVNAFDGLDPVVTKDLMSKLNIINVGPLSLTLQKSSSISDKHGCLEWLDKHDSTSVAYVAFGTILMPSPEEIKALAEALEEKEIPFLWCIQGNALDLLPYGFVERTKETGKLVPWAPQLQVLGHPALGVHITHSGWNSVLESVVMGVPMICRPFFADHGPNTRLVDFVWKIGLALEGGIITKPNILSALERIFSPEEGKKIRENIGYLKVVAAKANGSDGNFKKLLDAITSI